MECVLRTLGQSTTGFEGLALGEMRLEGMGAVDKGVQGVGTVSNVNCGHGGS